MKPKKPPIPTSPARTSAMTEKAVTWHHEATCRLAVSGSHSSEGLCWVVVKLPYVPLHGGQACARPGAGRTARLTWGTVEIRPAGRRPAARWRPVPGASGRPRPGGEPAPEGVAGSGWFGGGSNRRRGHRLRRKSPREYDGTAEGACAGRSSGPVRRPRPERPEGQRKKMSLLISSTE